MCLGLADFAEIFGKLRLQVEQLAGICDPTGRVFGLMPHPERFVAWTQHPRWTRERAREVGDGLRIFQNAVRYLS